MALKSGRFVYISSMVIISINQSIQTNFTSILWFAILSSSWKTDSWNWI